MTRRSEVLARLESDTPASWTDVATVQPAREFLEAVGWDGEPPDPDLLTAREYLAWL